MPIAWGPSQPWTEQGPPQCHQLARLFHEYGTWYRGDPAGLNQLYGNSTFNVRPSQRAGGLYGLLGRLFWGQPQVGTHGDMERIHIPAAANLSALNADLLYTELPRFTLDGPTAAVDRLQEILSDGGGYAALAEGAELSSAYGSAYLRVSVDVETADAPIIEALPPHCAIPEWRYGRLVAVTFWRVLPDGRNGVVRHLERHEPGMIQHQLRLGSPETLGSVLSLSEHPETQRLASLADDQGRIATGIPLLDVVHKPNVGPNRECPGEPIGRSDYQGALGVMQNLDEAWSRWMDELRLARHRLIVPREYTRGLGPGKGSTFDPDQRIFTAVEALDPAAPLQIEATQFMIRTDDYERSCAATWRAIVRNAGYSADAFGEESSGAQATATEVGQRGARTIATRSRKLSYETPACQRVGNVITAYDARYYPGRGSQVGTSCDVSFPDGVTPDPVKDAQVVQMLDAAGKLSLETGVAMAHPDWDGDQVAEEVARIKGEQQVVVAIAPTDPGQFDTAPAPDPMMGDGATPPAVPAAMNGGRVPAGY